MNAQKLALVQAQTASPTTAVPTLRSGLRRSHCAGRKEGTLAKSVKASP